jgi:hypothetical protein
MRGGPCVQVKASMIAAIRRFQPQIVMSWWPYPRFEMKASQGWADLGYHPDHQVPRMPHIPHTAQSALTNSCRCVVFVRTGRGQIRFGGTPPQEQKARGVDSTILSFFLSFFLSFLDSIRGRAEPSDARDRPVSCPGRGVLHVGLHHSLALHRHLLCS